jgi:hypothetical protein
MDKPNMQVLETTIERAQAEYITHMKQFLMNARQRFQAKHEKPAGDAIDEFDDILLHIDTVDFTTMKGITHDMVEVFSKDARKPLLRLQEGVHAVHRKYAAHFSSANERSQNNAHAAALMKGVVENLKAASLLA